MGEVTGWCGSGWKANVLVNKEYILVRWWRRLKGDVVVLWYANV